MTYDHESGHEHELNAEYLYPSDAEVLDIRGEGRDLVIDIALPCPECDETVKLTTSVVEVVETDLEVPLDDAEDVYD